MWFAVVQLMNLLREFDVLLARPKNQKVKKEILPIGRQGYTACFFLSP
jgi:hypothetical protein